MLRKQPIDDKPLSIEQARGKIQIEITTTHDSRQWTYFCDWLD